MSKKPIAFLLSAILLSGCASGASQETPKNDTSSQEKATEPQTETKEEKKQDIKTDVFDSIIDDLKNDGYTIDQDYRDDDYPDATIYEAEKGETEYEFIIFKSDADAKSAMDRIIDEAKRENDETIDVTDDNTQLKIVDQDDQDTTIYALNSNSIVKGSSDMKGSEAVREQMITWGFIYGEQVTEQDVSDNK